MRLDALLDLDRELFLLVNRVQGDTWDCVFGYGTQLGEGIVVVLLLWLGLRAVRPPPLSEEPAADGVRARFRQPARTPASRTGSGGRVR